jgi:hypothetical protein
MKRALLGLSIAVALVGLVGCAGNGVAGTGQDPNPFVRFVNGVPDSAALEFFFDDSRMSQGLAYLQSTPNFAQVNAQEYDVLVQEVGRPETQEVAIETFERNQHAVLVAVGLVDPDDDFEKRMRVARVNFDRTAPVGTQARIVVVNGYMEDQPGLNPSIDFQNPGDLPLFFSRDIAFGTGAVIQEVTAGEQVFVARRNNTEDEITPRVTVNLEPGRIYLALVSGRQNAAAEAQQPRITFIELQTR